VSLRDNENNQDAALVLERIDNSQEVETSTGYWSESVPQAGNFNGRDYSYVDQKIHPDHIALLTQEAGACSLADGCGLNRNSASPGTYEKRLDDIRQGFTDLMRVRDKRASELGSETTVPVESYVEETTDTHVFVRRGNDYFQVGYTYNPASGKVYFDDEPEWIPVIKDTRYVHKVAQNHYGPGPHKDGSPQSVHGGKGAGSKSASTSTTGKAGGVSLPKSTREVYRGLKERSDLSASELSKKGSRFLGLQLDTLRSARSDLTAFLSESYGREEVMKGNYPDEYNKVFDTLESFEEKLIKARSLKVNVTGSLPAEGKDLWESVYQKAKEEHDEEKAAKIAWGAVKRAGWKEEDGKWMKTNHYGPGPHKSGSPQSIHGGKGAGSKSASKVPIKERIVSHPMWSESDYKYLQKKGYSDEEILSLWDRDSEDYKRPIIHDPIPDVVSVISGKPKKNQQDLEGLAVALSLLESVQ